MGEQKTRLARVDKEDETPRCGDPRVQSANLGSVVRRSSSLVFTTFHREKKYGL